MLNAPYIYASSLNLTKFLHLQKKPYFLHLQKLTKSFMMVTAGKRDICLGIVTPEKKEGT